MTLNQIAEDGAYKLGDQFNATLRESIKHTILELLDFPDDEPLIDPNAANKNSLEDNNA